MEIPTVLGITWRIASASDIMTLIGILLVPVMIIVIIRLYKRYKNMNIHDSQLFLFRLKHLGLSNFQIKIINNLVGILRLSNPNELLSKPEFFESAVGRFLVHARGSNESEDSLKIICKDISIIYDKLYHPNLAKTQLKSINDINEDQLIYFTPGGGTAFIGKITALEGKNMRLKTYGYIAGLKSLPTDDMIVFHLYRLGDAEYSFTTKVISHKRDMLIVEVPQDIERGKESRHPYIDVIIPAQLSIIGLPDQDEAKMDCTIYKINEYEAVLRINIKLDHNFKYILEFNELDFNFKIVSRIISQKTVEESGVFYYTFKFEDISESANHVLKKYIYEHL
jgi:c-di-GMP-binding flagellar brake protein YcgR